MMGFNKWVLSISVFFISCGGLQYSNDYPIEQDHSTAPRMRSGPSISRSNAGMPNEPGKCYAKCLIPDQYEYNYSEYPKYTGTNFEDPNIEKVETVAASKGSKWIKKKTDNCLAPDPEDCLVWCLVDDHKEAEYEYIVRDTALTDEYKIEKMESRTLVEVGGFTDWREVLCHGDINKSLKTKVQTALQMTGFYEGEIDGNLDNATKSALINYQKENGLPIGQLDIETLRNLGITGY